MTPKVVEGFSLFCGYKKICILCWSLWVHNYLVREFRNSLVLSYNLRWMKSRRMYFTRSTLSGYGRATGPPASLIHLPLPPWFWGHDHMILCLAFYLIVRDQTWDLNLHVSTLQTCLLSSCNDSCFVQLGVYEVLAGLRAVCRKFCVFPHALAFFFLLSAGKTLQNHILL